MQQSFPSTRPRTDRRTGRSIGLLGGSFNPAHAGHLHISIEAMARLGLDEIWWLVSPHNPLKSATDLADYATRVAHAKELTQKADFIKISQFEHDNGYQYSVDTIRALKRHYPQLQFVWLMGADNLTHFHRWRAWQTLAGLLPIAIFDRAPFTFSPLASRFCTRYRRARIKEQRSLTLATKQSPAWCFIHMPRHPLSATFLRKSLGEKAFLPHNSNKK